MALSSNRYMLSVSHFPFHQQQNLIYIWQLLALLNHPGKNSFFEYSPGPNQSNPSFYWFRKMYLRFTESNLSSFMSHIVHIVCAKNSQGALGSFQLHTGNVMINTFFLMTSAEGFPHITEKKPNYRQ